MNAMLLKLPCTQVATSDAKMSTACARTSGEMIPTPSASPRLLQQPPQASDAVSSSDLAFIQTPLVGVSSPSLLPVDSQDRQVGPLSISEGLQYTWAVPKCTPVCRVDFQDLILARWHLRPPPWYSGSTPPTRPRSVYVLINSQEYAHTHCLHTVAHFFTMYIPYADPSILNMIG